MQKLKKCPSKAARNQILILKYKQTKFKQKIYETKFVVKRINQATIILDYMNKKSIPVKKKITKNYR